MNEFKTVKDVCQRLESKLLSMLDNRESTCYADVIDVIKATQILNEIADGLFTHKDKSYTKY